MPSKKLFLLDAMALIYRAHFAFSKNPRINSKGQNTGAALGFTNSLVEILQKEKPSHLAVVFDTSAPTFRHQAYAEYKANRQAQPEDIQLAIPVVKQIVEAFNIPVILLDGFEADDIIGTLAKKAAKADFEVFMMTPDKDYGQLVEDHIYLYKPSYMGNAVEVWDIAKVLEKWDIERIDQVADMLGLQGDAVDNIPGIPGIGPKTASKLLAQYGTVENLVANAHELKGKQKERVIEFGDQGILSKQLATIDVEVPIPFEEEKLLVEAPNKEVLTALFDELEFRTLARRVLGQDASNTKTAAKAEKAKSPTAQTSLFQQAVAGGESNESQGIPQREGLQKSIANTPHQYHLIDTPELARSLATFLQQQEIFCFDTETTSLNASEAELVGLAFAYRPGEAYYVPFPEGRQQALELLQLFNEPLTNPGITKIGQNLKYDLTVLRNYGMEVAAPFFDTMLAHYLLQPDMRHGMDSMADSYLNYQTVSIEELIGKKGKKQDNMRNVAVGLVTEYAAEDADITLQLYHLFAPELKKSPQMWQLFQEVEMPLMNVLAEMEANGVKIDEAALSHISEELSAEIVELEKKIYEVAGTEFNIASPKQLGEILFDRLKLIEKPKKTKSGQYATGEEILVTLAPEHPIVQDILDFRQMQKLKSTYVDALPQLVSKQDGLIHTSYNQAVTATGRLSSTNPNLQNIPIRTERGREIRKAFVPRESGRIILAADYSQIELRIMAAFSGDETMISAFSQGKDIHSATAAKVFKVPLEEVDADMRRKAKTANFGIIYGISAHGLSQRLNIPRKDAADIIEAYFNEFPAVKQYMDEVVNQARQQEYVETIMGRRRYLRDINSRNFTQRGFAERNAINAPIQGSAADIIKKAMIDIYNWMKTEDLRSQMTMQVHDELVFDVAEDEFTLVSEKVKTLMENAVKIKVPLEVEFGQGVNWLEAH